MATPSLRLQPLPLLRLERFARRKASFAAIHGFSVSKAAIAYRRGTFFPGDFSLNAKGLR
jgi:hypothetical protein